MPISRHSRLKAAIRKLLLEEACDINPLLNPINTEVHQRVFQLAKIPINEKTIVTRLRDIRLACIKVLKEDGAPEILADETDDETEDDNSVIQCDVDFFTPVDVDDSFEEVIESDNEDDFKDMHSEVIDTAEYCIKFH